MTSTSPGSIRPPGNAYTGRAFSACKDAGYPRGLLFVKGEICDGERHFVSSYKEHADSPQSLCTRREQDVQSIISRFLE